MNLLPPLSPDEYEALKADIGRRGVVEPIKVDESGDVIDGNHRLRAASELGLDCPRVVMSGLTDDEKRAHAYSLNLARRHLSREQRRLLIERELVRDPTRSDRTVASLLGVSHNTAARVRRELEQGGHIDHQARRVGRDGVRQPASKRSTAHPKLRFRDLGDGRVEIEIRIAPDHPWMSAAAADGLPFEDWFRLVLDCGAAEPNDEQARKALTRHAIKRAAEVRRTYDEALSLNR